MPIELTDEQKAIATEIDAFIRDRYAQKNWFCYQGPPGTGKSVLLAHLARKYPGALLCAFTGKAASVVSRKSGLAAQTVHSAIYTCYGKDAETEEIKFGRKIKERDWHGRLVLLDEASTCNEWLAADLLATGCKVIACGDRNQLPPVKGRAFFTDPVPDAQLTEVHRQAWDSAIIRQVHNVIAGYDYISDGDDFRIQRMVSRDDLMAADVVICWRNATRVTLNRLVRAHHGLGGTGMRGEPVMALKNSPEWGILNGAVYTLLENHTNGSGVVSITNERGQDVRVQKAWIEDMEGPLQVEESNPFAWARAATCHKYQGSEADRVILVDEYDRQQDRDKWLCTGISRAAKSIIVQRCW